METTGMQRHTFNVTGLVRHLREKLETDPVLEKVWVQGEISNFKHPQRGHMYFTLKDADSQIKAVMFRGNNRRLRFQPRDGDDVLVRGYISVFERTGQVQLYVQYMEPNGIGDRYLAFQQLKEALAEEGLFAEEHKKPLPAFPKTIGLVTSADGAAVRDVISTVRRRSPLVNVLLYPVPVQGDTAPAAIAKAIDHLNRDVEVDVIIVGRGGGSLEELWAFNEEVVARSIFRSNIPVVSAVGHETDVTVADFVADARAATPTAAAELVTPPYEELQERLTGLRRRLKQAQQMRVDRARERLEWLQSRPVFRKSGQQLIQYRRRLDDRVRDLQRIRLNRLEKQRNRLERANYRLQARNPVDKTVSARDRLKRLQRELELRMRQRVQHQRMVWLQRVERLEGLSPLKVMKRGYGLVFHDKTERLVRSVRQVESGDLLRIRLADGMVKGQVINKGVEENDA